MLFFFGLRNRERKIVSESERKKRSILEEVERRQGEDESGGYAKVQLFIGKDDL